MCFGDRADRAEHSLSFGGELQRIAAPVDAALGALTFAAGGPGYVVFAGLLVAGISIAGLIGRVLPPWLGWGGLAVAVISELASLSALFDGADFLLPIGRFGGLIWLIAIGVRLPATRRERAPAKASSAPPTWRPEVPYLSR